MHSPQQYFQQELLGFDLSPIPIRQQNLLPHVARASGNNEWYTPPIYIEAARRVMGGIDLDPASCAVANEVVKAGNFYTAEDDGLSKPWAGRVWMNPPYSSDLIGRFVSRLSAEYALGDVDEALALVNNATDTRWWDELTANAAAFCLIKGRVRFWAPGKESSAPLQGQAVVYLGRNSEAFRREFSQFGRVSFLSMGGAA